MEQEHREELRILRAKIVELEEAGGEEDGEEDTGRRKRKRKATTGDVEEKKRPFKKVSQLMGRKYVATIAMWVDPLLFDYINYELEEDDGEEEKELVKRAQELLALFPEH